MGHIGKSGAVYVQQDSFESDEIPPRIDLVAFCQLRWNFVWQRPQHLMSRWARTRRVFFIEEPVLGGNESFADFSIQNGVHVVVPRLQDGFEDYNAEMKNIMDNLFHTYKINDYIFWYWTPMALAYTRHFTPELTIYDCMDDLSSFPGPRSQLKEREKELLVRAELVFTGGQSLYEARRYLHPNIHSFPGSIDVSHFNQARFLKEEPLDQKGIPHPRLGYLGVIDERMDLSLLRELSESKPDWHFLFIGPIVKIKPDSLPQASNIHYLGMKKYEDLPLYLSGWDVALLPFAHNQATRFVRPTKTPEYLAAGCPVVATSMRDIVRPYGEMSLVQIADTAPLFVQAVRRAFAQKQDRRWLMRVDAFLEETSWDRTWRRMDHLVGQTLRSRWMADVPSTSYLHTPLIKVFSAQGMGEEV